MPCPKAAMFDVDETLAESFQSPTPEMYERLRKLIDLMPVAIISGAGFARLEQQLLPGLTNAEKLYLFPNSATQCYRCLDGVWDTVYNLALSHDERAHIKQALQTLLKEMPELAGMKCFGQQISDREAQVAFTAVGLDAPQEYKLSWDPDKSKRIRIVEELQKKIPGFDILIGGASTIDVTHKGVNKAHGVAWFSEHLKLPVNLMLYVGDALYPGGNDFVVIQTGIPTRMTRGPQETLSIIDQVLAACSV